MTVQGNGPVLLCERMPTMALDALEPLEKWFTAAQPVVMGQAWRETVQPEFRPATVRCGWNEQQLLIYAVLEDDDIFNPVTVFNEQSFRYGDVFELFLRPAGQEAYYEFHVTPQNQIYQVRFPSAALAASVTGDSIPREWFVKDWQIESCVKVDAAGKRWEVLVQVPLHRVVEDGLPPEGRECAFSFSRYDYTRGAAAPVLSSTSPHKLPRYHRQQEWGRLLFG